MVGGLLGTILDIVKTIAPYFVVGVVLVLAGRGVRRVVLFWRGRSPLVQITAFSWAAGEGDRESLWVTSLFREHLKKLQLDGLDPIPDRAPGAPFVEIVEGVGQAVGQGVEWGRVMGRLYRAVVPDCAYEAWATLRPQGEGAGSISIQLIKRAGGNRTLVSFTSKVAPWDTCAREAAMAAAGALYPHLATRFKGPWADWRQSVPPDLLGLYQGALRDEQDKQFEQALRGFRKSVEKDPLNPQLRLKVAMLEERLGLHLDAWFTYWLIVAESKRKLWNGAHRRTRLVALYRLAIHLWNPELARQWVAPGVQDSRRAPEGEPFPLRTELRNALRRERVFRGGHAEVRDGARRATASRLMGALAAEEKLTHRPSLMLPFRDGYGNVDRTEKIAEILQIVSLGRLEELKNRMCHRRPLRTRLKRKELPRLAIEASELLLRTRIARSIECRLSGRCISKKVERHQELLERWPFPGWEKGLRARVLVRHARVWLGDRREDAWQLHYNAACAIAVQLSDDSIRRDRREESTVRWTKAAVGQLESFSYHAESHRVAAMADWIAFEDQDLDGLYKKPEFKLWGSQRFGFDLPEIRPPRDRDIDRHTVLILRRSATSFAASWRRRAGMRSVAPPSLLGWWKEELGIWEELKRTCCEHRNWHCRLDGLEALEGWNAVNEAMTVDLARTQRDFRSKPSSIPQGLLEGLDAAIGSEEKGEETQTLIGWVADRVREVETAHEHRLRVSSATGVADLPQAERDAAVRVSTIWSGLEARLETALRDSEAPDWTTLYPADTVSLPPS